MLLTKRVQNLLGVTTLLWVLFAFSTFLNLALATPLQRFSNELSRRAGNTPGLGVEIEMGKILIEGLKKLTAEKREEIKGKEIKPDGFDGGPKTNWALTAEVGSLGAVLPEAIVDGLKNKVGDRKTKAIGEEIFKFFKNWAPCKSQDCKVSIKGFDDFGPWSIQWPKDAPVDLDKYKFSLQATTAMPLEAVLKILGDVRTKTPNPLASKGALYGNRIKILTKDDFKSFSKIKASDITDEFLGIFSLLTSYCVLADFSDRNKGPKHLLPIMPRTDFVSQYTKFIEPKLRTQLSDKKTSLYDIVEKVSGVGSKLAKETFKWKPGTTTKINEDWQGKAEDVKTGNLEVQKFLNYLQGYDKVTKKPLPRLDLVKLMDKTMRLNQIGSLGTRMETVLGTNKLVPIFEFRELDEVKGHELGAALGSYEDKVIEYHKQFAKRSIDI